MAETDASLMVAAARAGKLLQMYGVNRPQDIRLDDLAWAQGIEIVASPLTGAEAHLVRVGDSGTITIRQDIPEEGRKRFAIAHEIGHWELHSAASQLFFCSADDMRQYQQSGREIEANTFASEFLIPRFMIDPALLRVEPCLEVLQALSRQFNASLTSAAVRYVSVSRHPVLVAFSNGQKIKWWRRNDSRLSDVWFDSEQVLSQGTVARDLSNNPQTAGKMTKVSWSSWFPHIPSRGDELFECAIRLEPYTTVLSLIWIPTRY